MGEVTLKNLHELRNCNRKLNCYFSKEIVNLGYQTKYGSRYSRMDQVKFFKGCLPQILLGSSPKQYLFGLLFSKNAKKIHTDKTIPHAFILFEKKRLTNLRK